MIFFTVFLVLFKSGFIVLFMFWVY